jgi:DNA-binding NtrC family response regulator
MANNVRGVTLPTTLAIAVIVKDAALLRALAFALQAHGHRVSSYRTWKQARKGVSGVSCVIVDGCLPAAERDACLNAISPETSVVLLAEDDTVFDDKSDMKVVYKPLSGGDVLAALASIRRTP